MTGLLKRIRAFGSIDAESEAQLGDFFLRTEAYARIEDQKRIVVAGRKGTGKTAIYKTLIDRPLAFNNVSVAGLQFQGYPWATHPEDENATAVERYVTSWTFLILIELSKLALTSANHKKPESDTNGRRQRRLSALSSGTGAR